MVWLAAVLLQRRRWRKAHQAPLPPRHRLGIALVSPGSPDAWGQEFHPQPHAAHTTCASELWRSALCWDSRV